MPQLENFFDASMASFAPDQGALTSGDESGYLVAFKAGRAFLEPGSAPDRRKVVSDKTKGTVFIQQTNDELIHFCWKNRETNVVVDDLIIFPEDTQFLKVKECTDGRVFMLKFENNDRRLFWLQESRNVKTEEILKKMKDALNGMGGHVRGPLGAMQHMIDTLSERVSSLPEKFKAILNSIDSNEQKENTAEESAVGAENDDEFDYESLAGAEEESDDGTEDQAGAQ